MAWLLKRTGLDKPLYLRGPAAALNYLLSTIGRRLKPSHSVFGSKSKPRKLIFGTYVPAMQIKT